jgi:hypothetical protein
LRSNNFSHFWFSGTSGGGCYGKAVTRNPTAEWLARQITEAFPWDSAPKYLIRDNDRAFDVAFKARVRAMGPGTDPRRTARPGKPSLSRTCVCRKLDSAILVMKSAEDRLPARAANNQLRTPSFVLPEPVPNIVRPLVGAMCAKSLYLVDKADVGRRQGIYRTPTGGA